MSWVSARQVRLIVAREHPLFARNASPFRRALSRAAFPPEAPRVREVQDEAHPFPDGVVTDLGRTNLLERAAREAATVEAGTSLRESDDHVIHLTWDRRRLDVLIDTPESAPVLLVLAVRSASAAGGELLYLVPLLEPGPDGRRAGLLTLHRIRRWVDLRIVRPHARPDQVGEFDTEVLRRSVRAARYGDAKLAWDRIAAGLAADDPTRGLIRELLGD